MLFLGLLVLVAIPPILLLIRSLAGSYHIIENSLQSLRKKKGKPSVQKESSERKKERNGSLLYRKKVQKERKERNLLKEKERKGKERKERMERKKGYRIVTL